MKRDLVNEAQPFGAVYNSPMMGSGMNGSPSKNALGKTTEWACEGVNQTQSFANKAPGAHEKGCMHADNPFHWVGKSFESEPTFVGMWPSPL